MSAQERDDRWILPDDAPRCPVTGHGTEAAVEPSARADRSREGDAAGARQDGRSALRRERHRVLVSGYTLARAFLRDRGASLQAGFTAERIPDRLFSRRPLLISDGEAHDAQRRELGRFFAPAVIARRHGPRIAEQARAHTDRMMAAGEVALDEASLHYSVEVTAQIVGLTSSSVPGLSRRLERFFTQPPVDYAQADLGRGGREWALAAWRGLRAVAAFWALDVAPALRSHRRSPREDVIGHLLDSGASRTDVLVEAMTYGTAGMVTTREFIVAACWHLLQDPALRARYEASERAEREGILREIIRVEPVVGHLYRRAVAQDGLPEGLRTGDLVDVDVRAVNADPALAGACPFALDPDRQAPGGPAGISFGIGPHRCPGEHLALRETDELLMQLLAAGARMVAAPSISWDSLIAGYRLRGLRLRFGADPAAPTSFPSSPTLPAPGEDH